MQLAPFCPAVEGGGEGVESRFIYGDMQMRLEALRQTMRSGVQLAYMDPPFATGRSFTHKMRHGGGALALRGYDDPAAPEYHARLYKTLAAIWELLTPTGAVVVHVDHRLNAHIRLMLDDIFGAGHFVNEIVWAYGSGGRSTRHFSRKHDTLLVYRRGKDMFFNAQAVARPRGPERRNHMKRSVDASGRVQYSIRSNGRVYTYGEDSLKYPSDVWTDISHLQQRDPERTGYATQKPEALLERLLKSMAREGDMILDPCSGSGTTAVVARRLGMRFTAVDNAALAAHTLRMRLSALSGALPGAAFYDMPCDALDVQVRLEAEDGGVRVTLLSPHAPSNDAQSGEGASISYWALGVREGDSFAPICASVRERAKSLPMSLWLPARKNLALHIVNAAGQQAFWEII